MKRSVLIVLLSLPGFLFAQEKEKYKDKEKDEEDKPEYSFKEKLFTGGSISLAFYNNTFMVGGSPVLGYNLASWADAGIVVNYNYTAYRDFNYVYNDKLRQTTYGGGAFVKLYPVRFLFAQAQAEHNFIRQKYIPANGDVVQKAKFDANSFLVGGGYTSGRLGKGTPSMFYYLAVLFDVSGDKNSPYTDGYGRAIPIVRGGIQIPLARPKQRYD